MAAILSRTLEKEQIEYVPNFPVKEIESDEPSSVRQGRFGSWAKRAHQKYWNVIHS